MLLTMNLAPLIDSENQPLQLKINCIHIYIVNIWHQLVQKGQIALSGGLGTIQGLKYTSH